MYLRFFLTFALILMGANSVWAISENSNTDKTFAYNNDHYPFLAHGFNINNYEKCLVLIRHCPLNGLFQESSCVAQVLRDNKVCWQYEKLTHVLGCEPTQWSATHVKGFTIIDRYFTADGQDWYYIISKDYLIDTNIDPRSLSPALAKKYPKTSFFIVNWGKPQYGVNPDGSQRFTVILRVTDTCLACSVIGWATLEFNFTKEDVFLNSKLESFKQNLKPSL